jgi:hypothetical protein
MESCTNPDPDPNPDPNPNPNPNQVSAAEIDQALAVVGDALREVAAA